MESFKIAFWKKPYNEEFAFVKDTNSFLTLHS